MARLFCAFGALRHASVAAAYHADASSAPQYRQRADNPVRAIDANRIKESSCSQPDPSCRQWRLERWDLDHERAALAHADLDSG